MALDLTVNLDAANLRRFRRLLTAQPRIAAQSLTFTAERAQEAWRAANHSAFHMRRPWIDKGVRIIHATPARLEARVGTIDKYMGRHVKGAGEDKRAQGRGLFVPTKPAAQQGTHTQLRAALRRMDRTKTKPFWRGGKLLRRLGRGHDAALSVLAVMRQRVDIPERLDALGVVYGAAQRAFPSVYARLLVRWAASA